MKTKLWALTVACIANLVSLASAADPIPANASAGSTTGPAAVAAPAASAATNDLRALVEKIKAKLSTGQNSQAALSGELKEFDQLLAKYKDQKTDDVAQILLMNALLHVQVLRDLDGGEALFKQLLAEFPDTQTAKKAAEIMPMLEQQKLAMQARSKLSVGAEFPDFKESDITGQPLSLAKYKGKVVLVDFWATWCGPCVAEMPNVIAAYKKYHDKGFDIIGISLDENKDALEKFTKENGMTWAQYFDGKGWQNKLGKNYGITSIPASFLVDGEGKIIATDLRGAALDAELSKRLASK